MTALYLVRPDTVDSSISAQAMNLAKEFSYQCGFRLLPFMVHEMTRFLLNGFEPTMISEAIYRTSRAPRPSFAYLSAVMRNAAAAGQYDYASFTAERPRPTVKSSPSQIYAQRHYTEEELLAVSEDLIAVARAQRNKGS